MNENTPNAPVTPAAEIWWHHLSSSMQLMNSLEQSFSCDRSVVLTAKNGIPWRSDFYDYVRTNACSFFANRQLHVITNAPDEQPGAQVLALCRPDVRNNYWPGAGSIAQYLADSKDVGLCSRFIWVDGIESKSDCERWIEFVAQYTACAAGENDGSGSERAIFIIECGTSVSVPKLLTTLEYSISAFDRYALCMISASELSGSDKLKQYTAELAYNIGSGDTELCGELIGLGTELAAYPAAAVRQLEGFMTSREQLDSAVWNSQIKIAFPIIEAFRVALIKRRRLEIERHLPVTSMFGASVENAMDLDIGNLYFLLTQKNLCVESADNAALTRFHTIRNLLAHNSTLDFSDMEYILGFES